MNNSTISGNAAWTSSDLYTFTRHTLTTHCLQGSFIHGSQSTQTITTDMF